MDNLRFGNPDASMEEIRTAVRRVRAEEIIDRLEGGYEADVGEGGSRLSAGERQIHLRCHEGQCDFATDADSVHIVPLRIYEGVPACLALHTADGDHDIMSFRQRTQREL